MDTLKGMVLPATVLLCPVSTMAVLAGSWAWSLVVLLVQLGALIWVSNSEDPDDFIKQSRKLWRNIKGVF